MDRKKILLAVFFLFVISINPGARETSVVEEKLVLNNVRLSNSSSMSENFEPVEQSVQSFLNRWQISGVSVAIAKDGKLVYARGFGYADTATKAFTQPFNKFRIASVSKLVTAVGIMKLREQGKLSLDDKVFGPEGILDDPFFDEPRDKRVYNITVEHLLSHEGGWTQRYGDHMFMPLVISKNMGIGTPPDTKTIVRYALDRKLHYTPGSGRSYSNLGYSILGLVIEELSGMGYEEYCRKEVLEPLGIYDMQIAGNLPDEKAPLEVTYYEPRGAALKPSLYHSGELCPSCYGGNDVRALGAAGAWIATAPDLIRLLLAVDGFDSKPDLLSSESITLMTAHENGEAPKGWKSIFNDGTWWRTGYFAGTSAMMKRQSDGFSWVVLCNSSTWNGSAIYSYINSMMSKALTKIDTWPEYDLLDNTLPVPVKTTLSGYPG